MMRCIGHAECCMDDRCGGECLSDDVECLECGWEGEPDGEDCPECGESLGFGGIDEQAHERKQMGIAS